MSAPSPGADPVDQARAEMEPLLDRLCTLLEDEGESRPAEFFAQILGGLRNARDAEDLAGPFMQLSTCAFVGFVYSPAAALLVDRILECAQRMSMTLSAPEDSPH